MTPSRDSFFRFFALFFCWLHRTKEKKSRPGLLQRRAGKGHEKPSSPPKECRKDSSHAFCGTRRGTAGGNGASRECPFFSRCVVVGGGREGGGRRRRFFSLLFLRREKKTKEQLFSFQSLALDMRGSSVAASDPKSSRQARRRRTTGEKKRRKNKTYLSGAQFQG